MPIPLLWGIKGFENWEFNGDLLVSLFLGNCEEIATLFSLRDIREKLTRSLDIVEVVV